MLHAPFGVSIFVPAVKHSSTITRSYRPSSSRRRTALCTPATTIGSSVSRRPSPAEWIPTGTPGHSARIFDAFCSSNSFTCATTRTRPCHSWTAVRATSARTTLLPAPVGSTAHGFASGFVARDQSTARTASNW